MLCQHRIHKMHFYCSCYYEKLQFYIFFVTNGNSYETVIVAESSSIYNIMLFHSFIVFLASVKTNLLFLLSLEHPYRAKMSLNMPTRIGVDKPTTMTIIIITIIIISSPLVVSGIFFYAL